MERVICALPQQPDSVGSLLPDKKDSLLLSYLHTPFMKQNSPATHTGLFCFSYFPQNSDRIGSMHKN